MDQSELLRHCTTVLEQLGLRYFVTGSVATIFYGEPRFTNDIDIVVDLPRNYGYAEFSLNGHNFEVHSGVEFKGTSGMTHELDVCIMRGDDADRCRQQPDDPPPASLIAGWECKFYAGNLKKGLGRAFVGLIDDMGTNVRLSGLCSNSVHPQLRDYFQPQRRPHPHFRLTPLEPSNEAIFVNQIKGELKKMTAV